MKLRVLGDSIRLRVSQTELAAIGERGRVSDSVCFPNGSRLVYTLNRDDAAEALSATFADNEITVVLPANAVDEWVHSDLVALHGSQNLSGQGELKLLIEKDFACLNPRDDEDESDLFQHPQEQTEC